MRNRPSIDGLEPDVKVAFFLPSVISDRKVVIADEKRCAGVATPNDVIEYLNVALSPAKPSGWKCDAVLGVTIHARYKSGSLKPLTGYFSVGLRVLELVARLIPLCLRYDIVVSFQIPTVTLALGIVTQILGYRRPRFVIRELILWAGNQGFPPNRFKLALLRLLLRKADLFFCCSRRECVTYAAMLGRSAKSFSFLPLPAMTQSVSNVQTADGGFIVAAGRTGRDYGIVLEAMKDLTIPLKLICSPENMRGLAPGKFTDVYYDIPEGELNTLLGAARFVVIPLQPSVCSAGQRVFVSGMIYGKAIIATRTQGSEDYVKDGETGLLVEPRNVDQMRTAIVRLWNNPDLALSMGQEGRRSAVAEFTPESWAYTFWSRLGQMDSTL